MCYCYYYEDETYETQFEASRSVYILIYTPLVLTIVRGDFSDASFNYFKGRQTKKVVKRFVGSHELIWCILERRGHRVEQTSLVSAERGAARKPRRPRGTQTTLVSVDFQT